jgi:hypothetical protein
MCPACMSSAAVMVGRRNFYWRLERTDFQVSRRNCKIAKIFTTPIQGANELWQPAR